MPLRRSAACYVWRRRSGWRSDTGLPTLNQSIEGPHKATHGQGEAAFQHNHRGQQQTLRHEVQQAWRAKNESRQHLACATHSCSMPFYSGVQRKLLGETPPQAPLLMDKRNCPGTWSRRIYNYNTHSRITLGHMPCPTSGNAILTPDICSPPRSEWENEQALVFIKIKENRRCGGRSYICRCNWRWLNG